MSRLGRRLLPWRVRADSKSLWATSFVGSGLVPRRLRPSLLRWSGLRVGSACNLAPRISFRGTDVRMGDECLVNEGCFFDRGASVTLGREVFIGPSVRFLVTTHAVGTSRRRAGDNEYAPIAVGDGSWIGAGVTLLPGVTVGAGCIVAAGAVVTKDCAPDGLYLGVPARRVSDL